MKHSATSSEARARASWPLSEPTLTYFPNARFVPSDRDLGAGASASGRPGCDACRRGRPERVAVRQTSGRCSVPDGTGDFGHVPVLLRTLRRIAHPGADPPPRRRIGRGARRRDPRRRRARGALPDRTARTAADRTRPRPERAGHRPDPAGAVRRPDHPGAHPVRRHRRCAGRIGLWLQPNRSTGCFSTSASRPCSSTAPSGASPTPRTRRWTCGWTPTSPLTAADIVNTYDEAALTDILRRYGEERFARRIATHIVRRRARTPFTSTAELVELLYQAIPAPARRTGGHPAKRTFQALRIAVNDELDSLRSALPAALDALAVDGPHRGDGLPVAGGPHRQARVRRRRRLAQPGGSPGRTSRPRAAIPVVDARCRTRR